MPSSVVTAIQYEPAEAILRIIFVSGMVYKYKDVPESVYLEMKKARSKGEFLNESIKGNYLFNTVKD